MKLLSLTLENFMPYEKKHEIDFRTSESTPIILFLGENGHGKSSLFHAIRWCLYGETEKKKQRIGEFSLFNRNAAKSAVENPNVKMSVSLVWETQGDEYVLTRRAWFRSASEIAKEVTMRKNGGNPIADNMIPGLVRKFLPKEISHLFLYDGESQRDFDDMNADGRGRDFIQAEIENTLSIPYLRSALAFVKTKREAELESIQASQKSSDQVKKWQIELQTKKKEREGHEKTIRDAKERRDLAADRVEEISNALGDVDKFQELKTENELATQQLISAQSNRDDAKARLRGHMKNSAWLPLVNKLRASGEIVSSNLSANKKLLSDIALCKAQIQLLESQKTATKCVTCGGVVEHDEEGINKRIDELLSEIEKLQGEEDSDLVASAAVFASVNFNDAVAKMCAKDVEELQKREGFVATARIKALHAGSLLGSFDGTNMNNSALIEEYHVNQKTVMSMKLHIVEAERNLATVEAEINKLNGKIGNLITVSPQKQEVLDVWDDLKVILERALSQYINSTRDNVASLASETFVQIVNDPKWVGLELNQSYGAIPVLAKEARDDLTNTGSDKAISVALVDGLIRTALDDGFVLMDSPLVSWDKRLRSNFADWATSSKMKISLFLHTGEYDDRSQRDLFGGKVGAVYEIKKISEDESVIGKVA